MRRIRFAALLGLLLTLAGGPLALAVEPEEQLANPQLEARARAISRELRCLVCQSQTIDDSTAPVAAALRKLVRDRLTAGDSDRQVLDEVTRRYGDFVLLQPRLAPGTVLLWFGPALVLVGGGLAALLYVRAQRADAAPDLSAEEHELLARTLQRPGNPAES
jgi:cytochrome c-type biogenesis protein CcmH